MSKRTQNGSHFACLDIYREDRTGIPEVVIAEGKKKPHLKRIITDILSSKGRVIVTRVSPDLMPDLKLKGYRFEAHEDACMCVLKSKAFKIERNDGLIVILAAGTSDFSVGEEAKVIAEELGCSVRTFYDVGVAGVHRLFKALDDIDPVKVDAYIVLAGREGALPTLVSGLVDSPVIGVPVSTGYGKGGKGEAALMAMLQSCSPLAVVNIDAGFVAGAVAARIAMKMSKARSDKGPKAVRRK